MYLTQDVKVLAQVFQYFRDLCLEGFKIDPSTKHTTSGLSISTALRKTDVKYSFNRMILMI